MADVELSTLGADIETALTARTAAERTTFLNEMTDGAVARNWQSSLTQSHPWMIRGFCGVAAAANIPANFNLATIGTATAAAFSSATVYGATQRTEYLVTTPATNAIAAIDRNFQIYRLVTVGGGVAGAGGFIFSGKWGPATGVTIATHRAMFGLISGDSRPTDVEPSTLLNCIFMGWDAADTNIQMMHNDGSGTCTKIDLGASFPVPSTERTALYELELVAAPGTTQAVVYTVTDTITGATASNTISTDLPSTSTTVAFRSYVSAGGTSSAIGLAICYAVLDGYI